MRGMKRRFGWTQKYRSFFRIRFQNGLQYRAAAAAGVVTQFAWGLMEIMIYSAFYRGAAPGTFPMEMQALSSYIWLQQAMLALFMTWLADGDIFDLIASGNVAYELCRPTDLYGMWFVKAAASRISRAVLRCFPILLVAVFLPKPYGLSLPANPPAFILFLLSGILAFLLVVAYSMLMYTACFFTVSSTGVRIIASVLTEILSGSIVPLPFLPDGFREIVELLPFASMQNMPLRIYGGDITGMDILIGIFLQLAWLGSFLLIGKWMMKKALFRVVVQGG